jgi:hypothetical protein
MKTKRPALAKLSCGAGIKLIVKMKYSPRWQAAAATFGSKENLRNQMHSVLVLFLIRDKIRFGKTVFVMREGYDIFKRNHWRGRGGAAGASSVQDLGVPRTP